MHRVSLEEYDSVELSRTETPLVTLFTTIMASTSVSEQWFISNHVGGIMRPELNLEADFQCQSRTHDWMLGKSLRLTPGVEYTVINIAIACVIDFLTSRLTVTCVALNAL